MKAKKAKDEDSGMIRVKNNVKYRVQAFLIGKPETIGDFYTKAADERLYRELKKKKK